MKRLLDPNIPRINIDGVLIDYSEVVKYLGYFIDKTLSPTPQVQKIISNVYCALTRMKHLKRVLPNYLKLQLVQSLIFLIFDYGDIFYHTYEARGYENVSNKLQRCQNNVLRFVLNLP